MKTKRNGFTLIELLVGMMLSVIIFMGIVSMVTSKSSFESAGKHVGALHNAGTLALETIILSIKQADKNISASPQYLTINGQTLSIANAVTDETFSGSSD